MFEGLSEEEGLKSILFDEVIRMQKKIETMEAENIKRIFPYRRSLKVSLFFIVVIIVLIVKIIYN